MSTSRAQLPSPVLRPLSSRPVVLADRIGRCFPQRSLLLGIGYFRDGGVSIDSASIADVRATVQGKRRQRVRIAANGPDEIGTACTCGATSLGPAVCSHVWATILALDRRASDDGEGREALAQLRTTKARAKLIALPPMADSEPPTTATPEPKEPKEPKGPKVKRPKAGAARGRPSRRSPPASDAPPEERARAPRARRRA